MINNNRALIKQSTPHVTQIYSNSSAFAALRVDGSVVTWGSTSGGDSSAVAKQLDGTIDVTQIYSDSHRFASFAALRADGSVVIWGDYHSSGLDSSAVANQLNGTIDVKQIYSNSSAFAALRIDGSVVTWGSSSYGGDSSAVALQLGFGMELSGGVDNDKLIGSDGPDNLSGNAGKDILIGGLNKDNLTGGLGADIFEFDSVDETGTTSQTRDIIVDFNHGQKDKIDLSVIDANTTAIGNNAFSAPPKNDLPFSGVFKESGKLYFDSNTSILYGNNDADPQADFSILLTGVTSFLVATDFVL